MELKEIQDLIKFVAKSGVSEVELESKGFKLVIKTNSASEQRAMMDQPAIIHAPVQMAAPAVQTLVEAPKAVAVEAPKATPPAGGYGEIAHDWNFLSLIIPRQTKFCKCW
jgi:acetyl-CoA carboxylase biotin carboxyl carrier protein